MCPSGLKIIRKAEEVFCQVCKGIFHLKCIGSSYESNNCCGNCYQREETSIDSEGDKISYKCMEGLAELLKIKGLKICHQNICSLLPKIDEVKAFLCSNKSFNILGMSEIHLFENANDSEMIIPGYKLH